MKIFTIKNLLLLLVLIFCFFIVMSILKKMNIYEGLEDQTGTVDNSQSNSQSQKKNIAVMANNG